MNWSKSFTATVVSQDIGRVAKASEIRRAGSETTGEGTCTLVRSKISPVGGVGSTLSDGLGGSLTEAPEAASSTGVDEDFEAVLEIELPGAPWPRMAPVPGEGMMHVHVGSLALGLRRVRRFEPAVSPAKATFSRERSGSAEAAGS